jgi:hypothetical protein
LQSIHTLEGYFEGNTILLASLMSDKLEIQQIHPNAALDNVSNQAQVIYLVISCTLQLFMIDFPVYISVKVISLLIVGEYMIISFQ